MQPDRARRPGIYKIGQVTAGGPLGVRLHGWGVTTCATGCGCHRHPIGGMLVIYQDDEGHLGLTSFRPCNCCTPWTADELADMAQALEDFTTLQET